MVAIDYAQPGQLTDLGGVDARVLDGLGPGAVDICRPVSALVISPSGATALGVVAELFAEMGIRPAKVLIGALLGLDPGPLASGRPPERRVIGTCRHLAVLARALPTTGSPSTGTTTRSAGCEWTRRSSGGRSSIGPMTYGPASARPTTPPPRTFTPTRTRRYHPNSSVDWVLVGAVSLGQREPLSVGTDSVPGTGGGPATGGHDDPDGHHDPTPGDRRDLDCADPVRQARFWALALGYEKAPPPEGWDTWEAFLTDQGVPPDEWDDGAVIRDPTGSGPTISLLRVPEPKTAKNRLHLDLKVSGGRHVDPALRARRINATVAELVATGAAERERHDADGHLDHVVMLDPEGNEFCVV